MATAEDGDFGIGAGHSESAGVEQAAARDEIAVSWPYGYLGAAYRRPFRPLTHRP